MVTNHHRTHEKIGCNIHGQRFSIVELIYMNMNTKKRVFVIRQVCGQTLARVRVRTDIDSSIIISLQWRKSM